MWPLPSLTLPPIALSLSCSVLSAQWPSGSLLKYPGAFAMIVSSARNSPLGTLCKTEFFLAGRSVFIFNLKNTVLNNSFNFYMNLTRCIYYYYSHFTGKEIEVEDSSVTFCAWNLTISK